MRTNTKTVPSTGSAARCVEQTPRNVPTPERAGPRRTPAVMLQTSALRSGDTAAAVTAGLTRNARVISAAAAIMIVVFASLAISPEVFLKLIGLGLATAVLVDATIVRLVLVPAVMQLLGDANWWMPRWLDRVLPRPALEEAEREAVTV